MEYSALSLETLLLVTHYPVDIENTHPTMVVPLERGLFAISIPARSQSALPTEEDLEIGLYVTAQSWQVDGERYHEIRQIDGCGRRYVAKAK